MASGSLDYILNLTNLMTGYAHERKYDVQLFAGLVASMRLMPSVKDNSNGTVVTDEDGENRNTRAEETEGEEEGNKNTNTTNDFNKSRLFLGGEAGLQAFYQVSRQFKVFVEPKIRIYDKEQDFLSSFNHLP